MRHIKDSVTQVGGMGTGLEEKVKEEEEEARQAAGGVGTEDPRYFKDPKGHGIMSNYYVITFSLWWEIRN